MKILPSLVSALLLAGASIHAATAGSRPNVLFVVVDDMNTELGCYGNRTVKSPNIDRLAARGVRFDRAYCQYSLCNPSRTSFLSGRRPETSGVYVLGTKARAAMPDAVMLPQLFRQSGYFCAGAGKVHHNASHAEPESWDFYEDGKGEDAGEKAAIEARYGGGDGTPRAYPLDSDGLRTRDGLNARTINAYLEEHARTGKPFFLAAGFHKPHLPWTAPRRFFDLYPAGSIPEPPSPTMHNVPEVALQTELSGFAPPESRVAALLLAPLVVLDAAGALSGRPNIIYIVADDLGYGELGCYGGKEIPTPNIDALARSGVRFTSGYVTAPFCAASRAALLTGTLSDAFRF